jgi:glycosyltransferase involved in cell wall biosynthesis
VTNRSAKPRVGVICYDLLGFIADCLSRAAREYEKAGLQLKAYPMLSRIAEDRIDFAYRPSRVAGRFFTVTRPKAIPEGQTLSVNWGGAWACARENQVVVLLGIQAGTAVVTTLLGVLLRRRLIAVSQTLPPEVERQRVWWIRWLKAWVLHRCHVHVAQTPTTCDTLRLVYRIPEARMVYAPFEAGAGIFRDLIDAVQDQAARLRSQFGWGEETVFLFAGTLLRFKGVDTLLTAAAELAKSTPSFRLVIAGAAANAPSEPTIGDYEALAEARPSPGACRKPGSRICMWPRTPSCCRPDGTCGRRCWSRPPWRACP